MTVCQSGYQDVSGKVMKDTFLHITQHEIKASHAAQMWQMMCCWPSRCDMKGQTNVVLLPQDGTNSTISCFRCTASISGLQTCHSVHCTWCMVIWRDGLCRCTEPELSMTWPNSSTCVSILWAEQFTTVIKKKVLFKCNNHNCDFQTGNVCNVFTVKILSLSIEHAISRRT